MSNLRNRLLLLEGRTKFSPQPGAIRLIQDGELDDEQSAVIAAAQEQGRLVIVRRIVDPQ